MRGLLSTLVVCAVAIGVLHAQAGPKPAATAAPVMVLETDKGAIEIQLYQADAPKSVAHIVALVNRSFYRSQRFHRVTPTLIQFGDPLSRNMTQMQAWGVGNSNSPIGVAEITKKRRHVLGAVSMAYPGSDKLLADSQFFIMRRPAPEYDGKYTVFGKVLKGMDVVAKIERGDVLKRAYLKE